MPSKKGQPGREAYVMPVQLSDHTFYEHINWLLHAVAAAIGVSATKREACLCCKYELEQYEGYLFVEANRLYPTEDATTRLARVHDSITLLAKRKAYATALAAHERSQGELEALNFAINAQYEAIRFVTANLPHYPPAPPPPRP